MSPLAARFADAPGVPSAYVFRDLHASDLPRLAGWLAVPHLRRWWGDPAESLEEIREAMACPATRPMMVEFGGAPIAYLQYYDPQMEEDHPYRDQPPGTLGIDLSIGPPGFLGVGHGPAMLRQCAAQLAAGGAPRLVIDPDPANGRAIRAYEKAGFRAFDRRTTIYGPALMMARDAATRDT